MATALEADGEIICMGCERLLLVLAEPIPDDPEMAYRLGRQHGMVLHTHICDGIRPEAD